MSEPQRLITPESELGQALADPKSRRHLTLIALAALVVVTVLLRVAGGPSPAAVTYAPAPGAAAPSPAAALTESARVAADALSAPAERIEWVMLDEKLARIDAVIRAFEIDAARLGTAAADSTARAEIARLRILRESALVTARATPPAGAVRP